MGISTEGETKKLGSLIFQLLNRMNRTGNLSVNTVSYTTLITTLLTQLVCCESYLSICSERFNCKWWPQTSCVKRSKIHCSMACKVKILPFPRVLCNTSFASASMQRQIRYATRIISPGLSPSSPLHFNWYLGSKLQWIGLESCHQYRPTSWGKGKWTRVFRF